jgi:protein-disulfide isomerase
LARRFSKPFSLFKSVLKVCLVLGFCATFSTALPAQSKASAPEATPVKAEGSKTASITMEIFSDFQCPSCRAMYEQTTRSLVNDYVVSGKVYLVHRDFPLPMHKYSRDAARWANAAARIGKYEQVEAALYDNQAAWSLDGNVQKFVAAALTPADYKRAERLMEGCQSQSTAGTQPAAAHPPQTNHGCVVDAAIEKDVDLGHQVPVDATPTWVIYYKGQKVTTQSGNPSYTVLKQYLDYLLSH